MPEAQRGINADELIIVSVDDHVIEPPHMWERHLPGKYKALAPKFMTRSNGTNFWQFDGVRVNATGLGSVAGRVKEEYGCEPISLKHVRPGCYDLDARIGDMNVNGILSSLNFGSIVRFDGSRFMEMNPEHRLPLLHAYNDWHIDEWCGRYPGRNIPLACIPVWDIEAAVAEVRRVHAKGCNAITMIVNPTKYNLPSIHREYWEPLWKVCNELEVVICLHIGDTNPAVHASADTPADAWICTMPISIASSAAGYWLHLNALLRYPKLKLCLSEGGIGWIPYFLERCDFTHQHHNAWTHTSFGGKMPSDVFREHFIVCFIDDKFGLKNIDEIGEDLACYECDYPHSDSTWPDSVAPLARALAGMRPATIEKVTHANALKTFKFDAFGKMGGRDKCTVGALRAQAKDVDITPLSFGNQLAYKSKQVITSGDVMRIAKEAAAAV